MIRLSWVAALAAALAVPSAAQDEPQQTVEGAQKFLSVVASTQQPHFMAHYYIWPTAGLEYRIDGATGSGCATQFTGQPFGYSRRSYNGVWIAVGASGFSPQIFETVRANNGLQKLPLTVDWSRVTSISLTANVQSADDGSRNNVLIGWPNGFLTLKVADNAMAKRVEYAANFLKAACDRTAETGF